MSVFKLDTELNCTLHFDTKNDIVVLHVRTERPLLYKVSPIEVLDAQLKHCPSEHRNALLDARNYLYSKRSEYTKVKEH